MNMLQVVLALVLVTSIGSNAMNQTQKRSYEELKKEHLLLIAQRSTLKKQMRVFENEVRKILESKEAQQIKQQMNEVNKNLETLSYEAIPTDAWYYDDFRDIVNCEKERKEFMDGIFHDCRCFSDKKSKL